MISSHYNTEPSEALHLIEGWDHRLRFVFSGSIFEITLSFEETRLVRERFLQFLTGERTNAQWGFIQDLGSVSTERTISFAMVSMLEITPLSETITENASSGLS